MFVVTHSSVFILNQFQSRFCVMLKLSSVYISTGFLCPRCKDSMFFSTSLVSVVFNSICNPLPHDVLFSLDVCSATVFSELEGTHKYH